MKHFTKILRKSALTLISSALFLLVTVWIITFHPKNIQPEIVYNVNNAPLLPAAKTLKILSWNVQYMAGKNYIFFYDTADNDGPDTRPTSQDIALTLSEVARVISEEDPDLILLQEIDDGARRTDYQDQLQLLLNLLPKHYASYTSSFYWKALFVPHPRVMGSAGMKLSTISKYKIHSATRYRLDSIPRNIVAKQFHLKRAVLETRFDMDNGNAFAILNTHLSAFYGYGNTTTPSKQISQIERILKSYNKEGVSWVLGGGFNLLPPGYYEKLPTYERYLFHKNTELLPLATHFNMIPSLENLQQSNYPQWFTHFKNGNPDPDRTIDYIFYSNNLTLENAYVRQSDTHKISDHFPITATFNVAQ